MERQFAVSELLYGHQTREGRMLRTARHKCAVFNSGARPEMFFDLTVDPGETRNLARSEPHAGLLAEHRALLKRWISETGDDFKPPA